MRSGIKLIAITLALVAGFYASDIVRLFSGDAASINVSQYCLLSTQPCKQHQVSMVLSQDTAHPLVPNRLTVDWPETQVNQLELTLQGVEMEMGTAKYVLKKTPSGLYEADIILPVCTSSAMTWTGELSNGESVVFPAIRMER